MIEWANVTPEVFLAYGLGCTSGYAFAMRTALKTERERLEEKKIENAELRKQLTELRRLMWPQNERRREPRGDEPPP